MRGENTLELDERVALLFDKGEDCPECGNDDTRRMEDWTCTGERWCPKCNTYFGGKGGTRKGKG